MCSTSVLRRSFGSVVILSSALAIGVAVGGCKKSNGDAPPSTLAKDSDAASARAGKTMASLNQTQDELNTAKANVKNMVTSLQGLKSSTGPGINAAYKDFQANRATMEAHAAKVAERSADLQARGKAYREHWQAEVSKIESAEIRSSAEQRAAMVGQRFDNIRAKFEACRQAYQPFKKECADIDGFLSKEVSGSSLSLAQGAITKAIDEGNKLNKAIDDAIVELVSVSVKMAPEAK